MLPDKAKTDELVNRLNRESAQEEIEKADRKKALILTFVISALWSTLIIMVGYFDLHPGWIRWAFSPVFGVPWWYFSYKYSMKRYRDDESGNFILIVFAFLVVCPFVGVLCAIPGLLAYGILTGTM